MAIEAAKQIEQSATRRKYEFWKATVVHVVPDLGPKVLRVTRGIKILPDGKREVELRFDDFGVNAGGGLFTVYPKRRTWSMKPTLETIETEPGWTSSTE